MSRVIASPRSLLSYRERRSNVSTELSELVDNSLGADRGNAPQVHFYWQPNERVLSVVDNGRGMAKLSYLFGIGHGVIGSRSDVGRYGQGGAAALLWLADAVDIWTVRDGIRAYTHQDVHQTVDVAADWFDVDDTEWSVATTSNVPQELAQFESGTLIRMQVRVKKTISVQTIQRELSQTYASALRQGRRIVWHDVSGDVEIQPWHPGVLIETEEFMVVVHGLEAKVNAGIVNESIGVREAGISVCFGHRQILKTRDPFGAYSGGKLFGWVDLSPEWHDQLTNDKTDLTDDVMKADLFAKIAEGIQPLIDLLNEREDEAFAADLQLLANIQLTPIIATMFPDTSTWIRHIPPEPRPGPPEPPRPHKVKQGGLPIKLVKAQPGELEGRYMNVTIQEGVGVTVRFDSESPLVLEARQQRPINKLLLKSMITDEFAAEIVRKNLIVRAGMFAEDEWENLIVRHKNDTALLASFAKPRLFERIRELTAPLEGSR